MPDSATLPQCGLFAPDKLPIPLTGVRIDGQISDLTARVTVTQRFVNRETNPLEVVYVFPLDEGAAVCGFEAVIDGTLVVGEVQEREQAFRTYDEAIEAGHGGFLVDEERPDIFQANVGNLLPGKEVTLRLTYVTELNVQGGRVRFALPTTVSPRYAPAEDRRGVGRPDSEALNPPVTWEVPYGLELTLRVEMAGGATRMESPSHAVAIALDGGNATVTLSQRDTPLDRDFVLLVDAPSLSAPQVRVERDDEDALAIAVAFVPEPPQAQSPAEVVFLVDRSGSMAGPSIAEVRNALQLCLRSMIPGCRFNIVGFGSTIDPLFAASREYDDASLAEATAYVARLEADLGGTELLPALTHVLDRPARGSLSRQIVVITDGQVSNTDAVLAIAANHSHHARVFTFGIGAGASHHLVKGLARAAQGVAEFIYPGERIEPKVVRQFGRLLSPALTSVRVDWGGLEVTQAPSQPPPIFGEGRLVLYGFVRRVAEDRQAVEVRITAESSAGPVVFAVPVDLALAARGRTVATLAARARIRELEESPEWIGSRGSQQRDRKQPGATREILELGIRYGLITRETSYVAIERRDTPVAGDVQLRRVPIALTTGWGDLRGPDIRRFAWTAAGYPADVASPASAFGGDMWSGRPRVQDVGQPAGPGAGFIRGLRASPRGPRPQPVSLSGLMAVVSEQRANGSWELTDRLAAAIGRDLPTLESALGNDARNPEARAVWATALAIAWLHLYEPASEEEWRLVADKARQWLGTVTRLAPDGSTWILAAEEFLRR